MCYKLVERNEENDLISFLWYFKRLCQIRTTVGMKNTTFEDSWKVLKKRESGATSYQKYLIKYKYILDHTYCSSSQLTNNIFMIILKLVSEVPVLQASRIPSQSLTNTHNFHLSSSIKRSLLTVNVLQAQMSKHVSWLVLCHSNTTFLIFCPPQGPVASGSAAPPKAPAGGAPPPPPPGPPPPPMDLGGSSGSGDSGSDNRNALFAAINQGSAITKGR